MPGGRAEITVRFSASAKDACVPYGFGFDIDVNGSIRLWLSLSPGVVRADLHLDFSPDEGDAAVCAITNSLLLSHAGFVIGGTLGGGFIGAAASPREGR